MSDGDGDAAAVSFTQMDLLNAEKFAKYNYQIRLLELMYKKRPHLVSYLQLNDRPATTDDFYIPNKLADKCRVLDVRVSEYLCAKLSCNKMMEREPCAPGLKASYYWLGDSDYDVQCQPACFNVQTRKTYQTDGSRAVDMPQLNYHKGSCRIVPDNVTTYLEKPFYRSATQYERRVNDMPTGFSRVHNDRDYGCGFDYKNNDAYCAYYDRTLNDDGDCSYTWWETGLDAVVGMSFINTVKSTIRQIDGTEVYARLPDNLPFDEMPKQLRPEHTLEGWRADIREEFRVPPILEIIDVNAKQRETLKREILNERRVSTKNRIKRRAGLIDRNNTDRGIGDGDPGFVNTKAFLPEAKEKMQQLMENVIKMLSSSEFWTNLGVSWVFDRSLDEVRRFSLKVLENIQSLLSRDLYRVVERAFSKTVLKGTLQSTARNVIVNTALRTAGKVATMMAKMTATAASVVGWLLITVNVLDIIFSLWDPYSYNNMFPKELPNDFMLSGEAALRQQFGMSVVEYKFENLVDAIVTEDELLQLQLTSMLEKAIYLDNLEVNSEGRVIDKRDIIIVSKSDYNALYENESTRALARRTRFDARMYDEYNKDFTNRYRINELLANVSITLASLCLLTACLGLYVLTFFFVFLLLLGLTCCRLSVLGSSCIKIFEYTRA